MYRYLLGFSLVFGLLSNATAIAQAEPDEECSEAVITSFFPPVFVEKTLENFEVPEKYRADIIRELGKKDSQVIPAVEERASAMDPNPLIDPTHRQEAVTLFRKTLLDVFIGVMRDYDVTDPEKAQAMLDDIQKQKLERFRHCVNKYHDTKILEEAEKPQPNSDA